VHHLHALARVSAFVPALRVDFKLRRNFVWSSGLRRQARTLADLPGRTYSSLIRWPNEKITVQRTDDSANVINRVPPESRTQDHFIKPLPGYHKMLSFVEVITTPSADTHGTLLLLHFDSRRYLVGNVPEGAQRACIERGIGLRKVAKILATGRTEWGNLGGLLGLILSMADTKISAMSATATKRMDQSKEPGKNSGQDDLHVEVHGSHNLNHLIATSRRFIFRTGMPIHAIEPVRGSPVVAEPTWQDDLIKVWSMAISPSTETDVRSPRKRTYDEANGHDANAALTLPQTAYRDPFLETKKSVVGQMFNSGWKYDNLVPQPLSAVRPPAKIYVRDQVTKELVPYTGPLSDGTGSIPDITVYVREPWPGALTEDLPPTNVANESMCYIIKNHAQRGKFLPKKAAELKVPKGMLWSELAKGFTVKNEDGEDVTPEMVLAPGKEGGGCVIVDLPSMEFVLPLLERSEWHSDEIMAGVGAIIWILGSKVAHDKRVLDFQSRMSHMKHIVSSPDTCPNSLALDSAARNAIRHNHIDSRIFPDLQHTANITSGPEAATVVDAKESLHIAARRGLRLALEPTLEIQDKMVKPPLDVGVFRTQMAAEFENLDHASLRHQTQGSTSDVEAWKRICPHPNAEVVVLGTGSSHPSPARNVSGTLIRVPGCGSYLLDCGEGTLGTLRRIFPPDKLEDILKDLRMIWVSHLHADHHLGLASLVRAWSTATKETTALRLAVVSDGPMLHWLHEYGSAENLGLSRVLTLGTTPTHKDKLEEAQATELRFIKPAWVDDVDRRNTGDFLDALNLQSLNSVFVTHCPGAQAVSFTTKTGLKISYSGDCRPSPSFAVIGRDSHLLIHEATFEDEMRGEALAKKHSTTGEALSIASQMSAKACLLTHFSQRYPEMPKLGIQALPADSVSESHSIGLDIPVAVPEVPKLPDGSDIRVLFAFDYMRLRLEDVPLLQAKQPLLREMYDKGIGKDIAQDVAEEAADTTQLVTTTSNRQEKKKAKEASMKVQTKANKRKSQEWKQTRDGAAQELSHEAEQGVEAAGQVSGQ